MRGQFVLFPNTDRQIIIPNRVVNEGEDSFLRMIFQGNVVDVALGGNFYVGLCEEVPDEEDLLSTITTEPTSAGGYAREALTRDATGWPTVQLVNTDYMVESKTVTFTASGADFSRSINRLFLCNVLSGTGGKLFAYSGPLANSLTLLDGESLPLKYQFFLR